MVKLLLIYQTITRNYFRVPNICQMRGFLRYQTWPACKRHIGVLGSQYFVRMSTLLLGKWLGFSLTTIFLNDSLKIRQHRGINFSTLNKHYTHFPLQENGWNSNNTQDIFLIYKQCSTISLFCNHSSSFLVVLMHLNFIVLSYNSVYCFQYNFFYNWLFALITFKRHPYWTI